MQVEIREPATQAELELYYDLRCRILRKPWTQERAAGRDEHEATAFHLTAWIGDKLVGTGRIHFNSPEEVQVRGMAVEEGYAGHGIGSRILHTLEAHARAQRAHRMVLSARESALAFYRKNGFRPVEPGETLFGSIPHWRMQKQL
jgi:N-acetylglutamate synthase-like GNAT family acetyltransferase